MHSLSNKQSGFHTTLLAGSSNQLLTIREAIEMMEYGSFFQPSAEISDALAAARNTTSNCSFGREENLEWNECKNGL